MELMELNPIWDALVGLPGVDGLSIEQRKRLTIAVELVANPSSDIYFLLKYPYCCCLLQAISGVAKIGGHFFGF